MYDKDYSFWRALMRKLSCLDNVIGTEIRQRKRTKKTNKYAIL
jgi:hypothetical protein